MRKKEQSILKILVKILIVFFAIIIVGYYSLNIIMTLLVHHKKEVTIPSVEGMNIESAIDELTAVGLKLEKEGEDFDNNVPPGLIIRQTPPPGINVKIGKVIHIITSRGGEMILVPDLVGQTARSADVNLKATSLIMGEVSKRYSVAYPEGCVIAQEPVSGTMVDKGAVINIVLSDGLPPEGVELLPNFKGQNIQEAMELAKELNIDIEIQKEPSSQYLPNTVYKQIPQPDTNMKNVKKVKVFIAEKYSKENEVMLNYQIPNFGHEKVLKVIVKDNSGERKVFEGIKRQGAIVFIPVQTSGRAIAKIYFDNILFEEKEISK